MKTFRHKREFILTKTIYYIVAVVLLIFVYFHDGYAAKMKQMTFASPDKAFAMMISAIQNNDTGQLIKVFGKEEKDIFPANKEENSEKREKFIKDYDEKHRMETIGAKKIVLHVGSKDWPWPIPLVKSGSRWHFDTKAGIKEILARRIGRDEISAVQVCLAYVDSQLEYAKTHKVSGMGEYAQKFSSDPGKENGLCWNSKDGAEESPIGPLLAEACKKEMTETEGHEPSPYHGYLYKILKGQGKEAPGGAYSYVVDGNMVGGFALVAYPAAYGSSGITTFIVNKDGIVYERNLGKDTEKIAESMELYNPDPGWQKVD